MLPKISEFFGVRPPVDDEDSDCTDRTSLETVFAELAKRPVPADVPRRLWALGGLQGRIAFSYLACWLRSYFHDDMDRQELALREAHVRSAIALLETMGYLRGAVMKVGQAIANLPDILPAEIVQTLERLHFQAPPMHFAL
ncbi:MAG TPA: hypothetical protein VG125_22805, partial [Pirellulales bacterium]|nr:hypothetical protein [Pirellulales bacterium]